MATFEALRQIALSLPQAYEEPHFGAPAFRVNHRKFALLWAETGQTIFKLPRDLQETLFNERPETFSPIRIGTVFWSLVVLERLSDQELGRFVIEAWSTVVSKRQMREYRDGSYRRKSACNPSPLLD
jgi:hypothetical protein